VCSFGDLAKIQVDLVSRSCVIELCYFVDLGVSVVVFLHLSMVSRYLSAN